ncbi:MAG: xanthine dehydrogenase family protein molybdopterin-binding subunit [bacterium]
MSLSGKHNFSIVGKPVVRRDGFAKVTGKAKFADDYKFPGMLYGVMVRTNVVHARIKSIDYSALIDNPKIIIIIDSSDIPGSKKVGPIKQDQPIFCFEKIITPGDVVAMLVGDNINELKKLAKLVKIELEELPTQNDPEKALSPESEIIHPEIGTNLIIHYPLRKGDIEKGFSESENILEQTYTTQFIEHAYIEPECVIAIPGENGFKIKIIGSIQNPYTTRKVVASVINCNVEDVEVIQADLGGSFGGKDDTMNIISARAAVAALKVNRPVKIKYSREESVIESYKRHPYRMNYKIGFNNDGKLKAMKIDVLADGGAYASMSPFVTWRTVVQATGPYEVENVWTDVRAVYTNNPYTGAMRGFGSPQPIFAIESMMDEIACNLGKSPLEIRRINSYKKGSFTASGQKLTGHEVTLGKVIRKAQQVSSYNKKWRRYLSGNSQRIDWIDEQSKNLLLRYDKFIKPTDLLKKGIGLAVSYRGCSLGAEGIDNAAAYVSIQPDGTIYLLSGLAENGQGLKTTFSIICAEMFGISIDKITYLEQNTSKVPDSGPTVASRATIMGGGAVKTACNIIIDRLRKYLLSYWNIVDYHDLLFENNEVRNIKNLSQKLKYEELISLAYNHKMELSAFGCYKGPAVHWDEETGQGPAYFTYVYGCQVAEITANLGTGEVFIDNIWAVHDPGTVINLAGAEGQIYGGVTQGAGYALWEMISHDKGKIRETNFDQFLIPTSKDIDKIHPYFIEGKEKYGPWGAKSLGEPTLELTAAAIANAITNATGFRFFNLPLNMEEILLKKKLFPESLKRGSTS